MVCATPHPHSERQEKERLLKHNRKQTHTQSSCASPSSGRKWEVSPSLLPLHLIHHIGCNTHTCEAMGPEHQRITGVWRRGCVTRIYGISVSNCGHRSPLTKRCFCFTPLLPHAAPRPPPSSSACATARWMTQSIPSLSRTRAISFHPRRLVAGSSIKISKC